MRIEFDDRAAKPHRDMADMPIEIICTGDEALTGKIVNTNFNHRTPKLEDVGLAVRCGAGTAKSG